MNLINKKLLAQKLQNFELPDLNKFAHAKKLLENWQTALKDSDLEKTKEKSVQGKFLNTFFEVILGYSDITTGDAEWTLYQHPRIENDSKEPDGSLGWFTKDIKHTKAVIELKDAKTQLDKKQNRGNEKLTPVEQAYLYATKYDDCNWIIVSNFKEIRLYNKFKTQEYFEKFEILNLTNDAEFKRFYFLLNKDNFLSKNSVSIIDDLIQNSLEEEQDITKKFYAEYRQARINLFKHLLDNNALLSKEVLLEKTQKILDRLTFTLFCEDTSNLLPLNIIKDTHDRALKSFSNSDERVWNEFKGLFQAIDKGNKKVLPPINAYNGGLFAVDEILDNLVIKDDIWNELVKLSSYDFATDLNVNILGHIFEQSISDLESIKSELLVNEDSNKIISKRKKDGIFYTPEYVTKYIVEKTVGKFLEKHPEKLETLKILDPACGSGAFLNQAHSYLLNQYKMRHEEKLSDKYGQLALEDINIAETNKGILLNNLFGVDLNHESVEISKLALWLKTARASEPLQNLDKNIKCGNSLIDDPNLAASNPFEWSKEFKDIIDNGGFDVVIGNPPYVRNELIPPIEKEYYEKKYPETFTGKSDLYVYFFEQFYNLLNKDGIAGMIVSSKYTKTKYGKKLIKFLNDNCTIHEFIDFKDSDIFEGIIAYPSIIIFSKGKSENLTQYTNAPKQVVTSDLNSIVQTYQKSVLQSELFNKIGSWSNDNSENLYLVFQKLATKYKSFESYGIRPQVGIKTGYNKAFIINKEHARLNDPHIRKYVLGKDVKRYGNIKSDNYIIFPYDVIGNRLVLAKENELSDFIQSHLSTFRKELESRAIIKEGLASGIKKWYEYQQIKLDFDYSKYIVYPDISNGVNFTYAEGVAFDMTCFGIQSTSKTLLAILNSKVIKAYLENSTVKARGGYLRLKSQYLNTIPLPNNLDHSIFASKVDEVINVQELLNTQFKDVITILSSELKAHFKMSLEDFLKLGANQLFELADTNIPISQKESLLTWFKSKQKELQKLQDQYLTIDEEINLEVYKLYELTDTEIAEIEKSLSI